MSVNVLELDNVHFSYKVHGHAVPALNGLTLNVAAGEMVAIQGPSGSGKSTLLYLLGCMLKPDSGVVRVLGQDVTRLDDVRLAYFRNRKLGFVFQQFHLLPSTDVVGNVLLPTHYPLEDHASRGEDYRGKAEALARRLGLGDRLDHKTQQLSGGQQQRVAIARALIRDAPIILADEPTGNLDSATSVEIMKLLRELNREGKTIVVITHDGEVARQCDRVIWIRDGKAESSGDRAPVNAAVTPADDLQWPAFRSLSGEALVRESLPRAVENLRRNRTRSFLTMLGVVVGVASIMAMLTLGTFTKEKILQSYATLGINTLIFNANQNWRLKAVDRPPNSFTSLIPERDVFPLKKVFPEVQRLSPMYTSHNHSVVFGGRTIENEIIVVGVDENALPITRRELAVGSPIRAYHVENQSSVCVIGFEVAQKLFQRTAPLGQAIQVSIEDTTFSCVVIGVAKPQFSKDNRFKADLQVVLPWTSFVSLPFYHWYRQLRTIVVEVDPQADVEEAGKKIQAFFEKRYGKSGHFKASNDSVLVAQMRRFLNLFTLLLVGIAALSLLVGGMGITNMMLVAVNERFREIGLRKAMGASHAAIRQLFFAESLFLCCLAGVIGVVMGFVAYQSLIYLGSKLIPDFQFQWVLNPWALGVSFVAIIVTGVFSGLGPALKAEKLQVIEALRSE